MHVARGAHGVQRRHHHAAPVVPVVLVQRQGSAPQCAELVHAEHRYGVVCACAHRLQGQVQSGRATGAGVVDVEDGLACNAEFSQAALAG